MSHRGRNSFLMSGVEFQLIVVFVVQHNTYILMMKTKIFRSWRTPEVDVATLLRDICSILHTLVSCDWQYTLFIGKMPSNDRNLWKNQTDSGWTFVVSSEIYITFKCNTFWKYINYSFTFAFHSLPIRYMFCSDFYDELSSRGAWRRGINCRIRSKWYIAELLVIDFKQTYHHYHYQFTIQTIHRSVRL